MTKKNARGKTLEEYLISRDLHIINQESERTTFQSRTGRSNINLTIVNNRLIKKLAKARPIIAIICM
jgi:hypothetical protein